MDHFFVLNTHLFCPYMHVQDTVTKLSLLVNKLNATQTFGTSAGDNSMFKFGNKFICVQVATDRNYDLSASYNISQTEKSANFFDKSVLVYYLSGEESDI